MAQKNDVKSLLLFDLRTEYGPADVVWSHSRRSSLEQCPRRYYYDYFGASTRLAPQEPRKARLRFLKALQGRHERAGSIVHQLIATWFRRAQKGERWTAERLSKWGRDVFQRDRDFSAKWPDGVQPTGSSDKFPPVLLREFHYRDSNAQQLSDETQTRIATALAAFASAPAFEVFRSRGAQGGSRVEEAFRVEGLPCRTNGRVDLVFGAEDCTTVADWKLGTSDGTGASSLQLAAYAIWARQQFPSNSKVRVFKAFLADSVAREFSVSVELEAAVRARVVQDAQRMAVLQRYGVEGQADAFTACAQPKICALCKYQSVCPEGSSCRDS